MDTALAGLSKQQLITLVEQQQKEQLYLKAQIEQYKRMLFGQKTERFEADTNQLVLPFEPAPGQAQQQEEQLTEKIEYVRKKQSSHKGRVALPAHLPVEEIEIHPEGDLSEMVCIGKEVTEELECVLPSFSSSAISCTNTHLKALKNWKYFNLLMDTKAKGYLQADETPIKVLDSNKKGACHQGYY